MAGDMMKEARVFLNGYPVPSPTQWWLLPGGEYAWTEPSHTRHCFVPFNSSLLLESSLPQLQTTKPVLYHTLYGLHTKPQCLILQHKVSNSTQKAGCHSYRQPNLYYTIPNIVCPPNHTVWNCNIKFRILPIVQSHSRLESSCCLLNELYPNNFLS